MSTRLLLLLLPLVAVLTSCSTSIDRPHEIDASNVRACQLISPSDYDRLDLVPNPLLTPGPNLQLGEEGNGCLFQAVTTVLIDVNVVTNYGINRWIDGDVKGLAVVNVPDVLGYRTIRVISRYDHLGPQKGCEIYVDLADDQSLKIDVSQNVVKKDLTCVIARRYAESAMRTLTGR